MTVARLSRSIEVDPRITPRRRRRLLALIAELTLELQKELRK